MLFSLIVGVLTALVATNAPVKTESVNEGFWVDLCSINRSARQEPLQASTLVLSGEGRLIKTPENTQNYSIYPVDLMDFPNGDLTIQIQMGEGRCTGSFDLFDEKSRIPTEGRPTESLAGQYDIEPGSTVELRYHFTKPSRFNFCSDGAWYAADGSTNTFKFSVYVTTASTVLRDLPNIMRRQSADWEVPAKLMEKWLVSPAAIARGAIDSSLPAEVSLVSLKWVLDPHNSLSKSGKMDSAVTDAWRQFQDTSFMRTLFGKPEVARVVLERFPEIASLKAGAELQVGQVPKDLSGAAMYEYHEKQIQLSRVECKLLTPLRAALGKFAFYFVPIGRASRSTDGRSFMLTITKLYVHIMDQYSFNDDLLSVNQYLGAWRKPDEIREIPDGPGYLIALNSSFRAFRGDMRRGGDFHIFTKPEEIHLKESIVIHLDGAPNDQSFATHRVFRSMY